MTGPTGYFSAHLHELRRRVMVSFLAVSLASAAAYLFSEDIVRFFMAPLTKAHPGLARLVYTNLTEAFISYLKVALLVGLIGSFPVILYEIWRFVSPGLHKNEKRAAARTVFWGTMLFAGGALFAYTTALPLALRFLLGFADDSLVPLPKIDAYLSFVARTSLAFGLAFELPFLMVMAGKTGLVDKKYFSRQRKYSYLAIFVLAFLLTVGDILSAVLLALPLFGLYEAGIMIGRLFAPGKASS